jgi:hypothetical protein
MNQSSGETIVDRENLLESLGGNRELLLEVLGVFASKLVPCSRPCVRPQNAMKRLPWEHSGAFSEGKLRGLEMKALVLRCDEVYYAAIDRSLGLV